MKMEKVIDFIHDLHAQYWAFRIRVHSFGLGNQGKLDAHLWFSISDQRYNDVLKCLEEGANPNSFERGGGTCQLTFAVTSCNDNAKKIAKLLLDFGANPEGINKGDAPLDRAIIMENTEMIECLTKMIEQKNTKINSLKKYRNK